MKLGAVLLAFAMAAGAAGAQEAAQVVDLPTRTGVQLRMLVVPPAEGPRGATVVLLTGGAGRVGIYDNGSLRFDGNFLVRSRTKFAALGHPTLVLDVPSDRRDLTGDFRDSREHAADLGAAVAWARQRFGRPVWVVGTSRGTHSAALAATTLEGAQAPDGTVLTSSILSRGRFTGGTTAAPLTEVDFSRVRRPVLVVHHAQDACQVCPPSQLPALMARLPAGLAELKTYEGGKAEGPQCDPWHHHGFNGLEDRVVIDISGWMGARP